MYWQYLINFTEVLNYFKRLIGNLETQRGSHYGSFYDVVT